MNPPVPGHLPEVVVEQRRGLGMLTLNRPGALNALSLGMIRRLTEALLAWRDDPAVAAVLLCGAGRAGRPPAFCAGGDIRFFHQAALSGDPRLEDFFTEEYALDHLIHRYPKPVVVLMDGVTMGGGMGLAQGAAIRVVTEHGKLAMPETNIGLFPDVGGGGFLARCPGHLGEYLGLTGHVLGAADALAVGWADLHVPAAELPALIEALAAAASPDDVQAAAHGFAREAGSPGLADSFELIHRVFSQADVPAILAALADEPGPFARHTAEVLGRRSPLMLAVTLAQVRRARRMGLADEFRMERDMMRRAFTLRPGTAAEAVEGIRALAVDKDHQPRWNPSRIEDVAPAMVEAFFESPWPAYAHPLRQLD